MHGISSDDPEPEKRLLYLKMAPLWHQDRAALGKKGWAGQGVMDDISIVVVIMFVAVPVVAAVVWRGRWQ
jgi:hypothetical protein